MRSQPKYPWLAASPTRSAGWHEQLDNAIAALDRRVPQVQRAGEASIARDAAALKARALKRVEELDREQPRGEGV